MESIRCGTLGTFATLPFPCFADFVLLIILVYAYRVDFVKGTVDTLLACCIEDAGRRREVQE